MPADAGRVPFSRDDVLLLTKYIAVWCPSPKNRAGNLLYQEMANKAPKDNWVRRHSWQSWREKYIKNKERFDENIAAWQMKHGINPNGPPGQAWRPSKRQDSTQETSASGQPSDSQSRKRAREDDEVRADGARYQKGKPKNSATVISVAKTSSVPASLVSVGSQSKEDATDQLYEHAIQKRAQRTSASLHPPPSISPEGSKAGQPAPRDPDSRSSPQRKPVRVSPPASDDYRGDVHDSGEDLTDDGSKGDAGEASPMRDSPLNDGAAAIKPNASREPVAVVTATTSRLSAATSNLRAVADTVASSNIYPPLPERGLPEPSMPGAFIATSTQISSKLTSSVEVGLPEFRASHLAPRSPRKTGPTSTLIQAQEPTPPETENEPDGAPVNHEPSANAETLNEMLDDSQDIDEGDEVSLGTVDSQASPRRSMHEAPEIAINGDRLSGSGSTMNDNKRPQLRPTHSHPPTLTEGPYTLALTDRNGRSIISKTGRRAGKAVGPDHEDDVDLSTTNTPGSPSVTFIERGSANRQRTPPPIASSSKTQLQNVMTSSRSGEEVDSQDLFSQPLPDPQPVVRSKRRSELWKHIEPTFATTSRPLPVEPSATADGVITRPRTRRGLLEQFNPAGPSGVISSTAPGSNSTNTATHENMTVDRPEEVVAADTTHFPATHAIHAIPSPSHPDASVSAQTTTRLAQEAGHEQQHSQPLAPVTSAEAQVPAATGPFSSVLTPAGSTRFSPDMKSSPLREPFREAAPSPEMLAAMAAAVSGHQLAQPEWTSTPGLKRPATAVHLRSVAKSRVSVNDGDIVASALHSMRRTSPSGSPFKVPQLPFRPPPALEKQDKLMSRKVSAQSLAPTELLSQLEDSPGVVDSPSKSPPRRPTTLGLRARFPAFSPRDMQAESSRMAQSRERPVHHRPKPRETLPAVSFKDATPPRSRQLSRRFSLPNPDVQLSSTSARTLSTSSSIPASIAVGGALPDDYAPPDASALNLTADAVQVAVAVGVDVLVGKMVARHGFSADVARRLLNDCGDFRVVDAGLGKMRQAAEGVAIAHLQEHQRSRGRRRPSAQEAAPASDDDDEEEIEDGEEQEDQEDQEDEEEPEGDDDNDDDNGDDADASEGDEDPDASEDASMDEVRPSTPRRRRPRKSEDYGLIYTPAEIGPADISAYSPVRELRAGRFMRLAESGRYDEALSREVSRGSRSGNTSPARSSRGHQSPDKRARRSEDASPSKASRRRSRTSAPSRAPAPTRNLALELATTSDDEVERSLMMD